ncbi:MAG: competence protein ComEC [Actinomycetota bacterium]|nr:competence protein ComEC [Actinomycetota bacterium]
MADPRRRRLTAAVLAAAALLVPAVVTATPSAEAASATTGKVVMVDDGDTIDVDIAGDGTRRPARVRYIGIQTMELHVYSKTPSKLRGECWGVEAAKNLYRILSKKRVKLTSQHATSQSGQNIRPRRNVAVLSGGRYVPTGIMQLDAGLALPDLSSDEFTTNLSYMTAAQRAAANRVGMWGDPTHCGIGPAQDAQLAVHINWDAAHNDAQNVNGEWIDITNNGAAAVDISGWWIRDAAYRGAKAHGYTFPAGSVIQPGTHLRLHVGKGTNDANTQYWGLDIPIFANVTGAPRWMADGAWLFDPQGDLRSWHMYPCRYAC